MSNHHLKSWSVANLKQAFFILVEYWYILQENPRCSSITRVARHPVTITRESRRRDSYHLSWWITMLNHSFSFADPIKVQLNVTAPLYLQDYTFWLSFMHSYKTLYQYTTISMAYLTFTICKKCTKEAFLASECIRVVCNFISKISAFHYHTRARDPEQWATSIRWSTLDLYLFCLYY